MKKTVLVVLTMLLFPLLGMAQAAQKVAVVDSQEIILAMPDTKAMQTELDALMKKYEDTIVVMQEEFQTKYKAYIDEQETLVEAIKLRKEQELQDLAKRIEDLNKVAQEDIQKKQIELLTPIQNKVRAAIADVANENSYTYVMEKAAMLFIGGEGIDATPQVKSKLGLSL